MQYITEMCLDQATHYECFDESNGEFADVCRTSPCDNMTETLNINNTYPNSDKTNVFETLFFYRYYVWFLVAFTFLRALPQIVWKLSYTADVRKAIQDIAVIAEFQHAMCGVMSLVSGDSTGEMMASTSSSSINTNYKYPKWMKSMNRIVLEEVSKRASKVILFRAYVMRKLADIVLDLVIIGTFIWFQYDRTPFDQIVFVCDLHGDRDNIFLCESIHRRFVPCTVSFGFEFMITAFLVFVIMVGDCLLQLFVTLAFTRVGHRIIRKLTCGYWFGRAVLYWDPFISQELELNQNKQWMHFDQSFMHSPNDLYLVGLMYKQSSVMHGHFLKMMAEKMLEQLRPAFDYLRQTAEHNSNPSVFRSRSRISTNLRDDDNDRSEDDTTRDPPEQSSQTEQKGFDFEGSSQFSQYSVPYSQL